MRDELLNSLRIDITRLIALVKDIPDAVMTRQPAGLVNHGSWTIGHLTHSLEAIGGELGIAPWLPTDWAQRYGPGSTPTSVSTHYPSKDWLLRALHDATTRVVERLGTMTPADFAADLPDVNFRGTYPTVGHAAVHVLCSHLGVHIGQVTCWRRALSART
jgi:DinB family protein